MSLAALSTRATGTDGSMLEFFHTLEKLKTEKRTGWVNHKVKQPESIADHMYRMAMMALVIPESEGPPLNVGKCVMMSIVHDLAEADVGDITPPHASGISREEKLDLEAKAMVRIAGLLGHPSIQSLRVMALWEEYEARETPESKFVKDLDLFELATQAVEYENSNEIKTLQSFFESTVPRILHPTVKSWASQLMEQRRAAWTERGWEGYVHVFVTPSPSTNGVSKAVNGTGEVEVYCSPSFLTLRPPYDGSPPAMFPDWLFFRLAIRFVFGLLHSVVPLSIIYTSLSIILYPAPVLILLYPRFISLDTLLAWEFPLQCVAIFYAIEALWLFIHTAGRALITRGIWDLKSEKEVLSSEERWRIWVKMLESTPDPWDWFGGMFMVAGSKGAPRGMEDPAIRGVKMRDVGRTNVEEFCAHYMFTTALKDMKKDSADRLEIGAMVDALEHTITAFQTSTVSESAKKDTLPFKFQWGKSTHVGFLIYDTPIVTAHHPFIFYAFIFLASGLGNTTLWLAGFKYYGKRRSWPFPMFFMRGSRTALDKLLHPDAIETPEESILSAKLGYWMHPGSKKAQSEGLTPCLFFHGISGTYGPTPFIIFLRWWTGRPFFVPEFPYVAMRLAGPSSIATRRETVALARKMLWRHGFVTKGREEGEEKEEWRKGKVILVAHSLGGSPSAWVLRDAPDIVAGTVLVDPMSILLFACDGPRSFFRTDCRTAGQIFFRYFATERGINHFLSRHLRWTDSVIFGPSSPVPLPPSALACVPDYAKGELKEGGTNYAPSISPCPAGPIPSILFYSGGDCILPIPKIQTYLTSSGFTLDKNLIVMPGLEHAALLIRPLWAKEVAEAIHEVGRAAEVLEQSRMEKLAL